MTGSHRQSPPHFVRQVVTLPSMFAVCAAMTACTDSNTTGREEHAGSPAHATIADPRVVAEASSDAGEPASSPEKHEEEAIDDSESINDRSACAHGGWSVQQQSDDILALSFGQHQFGAIHTDSSYARFVPSAASGWGTSCILAPSFWAGGRYEQGTRIEVAVEIQCERLRVHFGGTIAQLEFSGVLSMDAPVDDRLIVHVEVMPANREAIQLDPDRPGEAFKLVMLSSMHESPTVWDASHAVIDGHAARLPTAGWIVPEPIAGAGRFGLVGGTSAWKVHAPTVMIQLGGDSRGDVTGWVTESTDPNDDNVGLWVATAAIPRAWAYDIEADHSGSARVNGP